jgi:hypothetical protein
MSTVPWPARSRREDAAPSYHDIVSLPSPSLLRAAEKLRGGSEGSPAARGSTRAQLPVGAGSPTLLLRAAHAQLASPAEAAARLRWSALLTLERMQKEAPRMPPHRRFLFAADACAPSGFLSRVHFEGVLTQVFGPDVGVTFSRVLATAAEELAKTAKAVPREPPAPPEAILNGEAIARTYADLWLAFSTPTNDSSTLARGLHEGRLPGMQAIKTGGRAFDVRMFGAAVAMLPAFRKGFDVRVALAAGLAVLASYATSGAVATRLLPTEGSVSRSDAESVLVLPLHRPEDIASMVSALDAAFLDALVTHVSNAYPVRAESRVLVADMREKVLRSPELGCWLGHRAPPALASSAKTVMNAARLQRKGLRSDGYAQHLNKCEEQCAPALAALVARKRTKAAIVIAAGAFRARTLLVRYFRELRVQAKRKVALRRVILSAINSFERRARLLVRGPFEVWRMRAMRVAAAVRLQSVFRMLPARVLVRRMSAALYISQRIGRLWRYAAELKRVRIRRFYRLRAIMLLQGVFRRRRVAKARHLAYLLKAQETYYRTRRAAHQTEGARRAAAAKRIVCAARRFLVRKSMRGRVVALRRQRQTQIVLNRGRQEVVEWIESQRSARAELDRSYPVPGVVGLSEVGRVAQQVQRAKQAVVLAQARASRRARQAALDGISRKFKSYAGEAFDGLGASPLAAAASVHKEGVEAALSFRSTMVISRFLRRVRPLIRARDDALRRFRRRYDLRTNTYTYVDVAAPELILPRPKALGPRHEVPVADVWMCEWDVRAPDGPFYFHEPSHSTSWHTPLGKVLCTLCSRRFAVITCAGASCGGARTCQVCFDGRHELVAGAMWEAHEWSMLR